MAQNPLQQFFRQPKIYINLPSKGAYNKPGAFEGSTENMPVYGMTGMDEILMKTPDALISGESVVKVIESCCPTIKDAWTLSNLDTDLVLAAIRIATYGNKLLVSQNCPHCETENEYELDMNQLIEHFGRCKFDNRIVLQNMVIKVRPLTYKQLTDFGLRNYQAQQQLIQALKVEDPIEQKTFLSQIYKDLGDLQTEVFTETIESIEVGTSVVTEKPYIREWLDNSDKAVFDAIKGHSDANKKAWESPVHTVECNECGKPNQVSIELDQSIFFVNA